MKNLIKKVSKFLVGLSATALVATAGASTVQAIDTDVVDEAWGKPTFVYGGGLSDAELSETQELFEINSMEDVANTPALGEDLVNYLGYGSGNTASMISSVLVQRDNNSGVNVDVLTPENITTITEQQYTNAAITAGVEDVNIEVASIRPVTGESALTGVYKALDVNGEELDQERMEVAQEELETTSGISEEENLDEEESSRLDGAIVDIKQQLGEIRDNTDGLATREEIEQIINDALDRYELQNVISVDNINILVNFFENYQQTSAIDSEQVREQLNEFANDLGDRLGDAWQQAEESGLLDRIVNFFRDIVNSIANLFN
jgi:uncharacterized protein YpuA (DUF1002 family)